MKIPVTYQAILKRVGLIIAFAVALLLTTVLTLKFGSIAKISTVAFCFIIIVLLSAFFGDLFVAIVTSILATLCFDFFYLPPLGTFTVTAFSDWISLAAFLLTSVIISRLTASATENKGKADTYDGALILLKEFGSWLMSIPNDQLTLSKIAEEALRIFSLEYCSIHVYGEGKWHHFTGTAVSSEISQSIESRLEISGDHNADLMEIVDENILGVRYANINEGTGIKALFVVKTATLSTGAVGAVASMVGVRIMETIKNKGSLPMPPLKQATTEI
jgi:K+-sensing histidine kinase KdpD